MLSVKLGSVSTCSPVSRSILEGLRTAIDNLDEIVKIIRKSVNVEAARTALMERFKLSRVQAQAILDMRLHQLTALERKSLEDEYLDLIKTIAQLKALLADVKKMTREDAYMLVSTACDVHVTQLVDGTMGVHVMIPKRLFVRSGPT